MTFSSIYEMFDPLTDVRKQRFWDWTSGSSVKSFWNETDVVGSGAVITVNDTAGVTGGYNFSIVASNTDQGQLDFNNIRQYEQTGSKLITVFKHGTGSLQKCYAGLHGDLLAAPSSLAQHEQDYANSFQRAVSNDGGVQSGVNTSLANSETLQSSQITLTLTNFNLTINGISEVDKTTDLPVAKLQPVIGLKNNGSANRGATFRYIEAINT